MGSMDHVVRQMDKIVWPYADKDLATLSLLEHRIAEAGRRERLITYSDLVSGIDFRLPNINGGKPHRIVTHDGNGLDRRIIGDFCAYATWKTLKKHGFMANALFVTREEGKPGDQFFKWMKQLRAFDPEQETDDEFWLGQVKIAHAWYKNNRVRSI